jgi:hypothetical protein
MQTQRRKHMKDYKKEIQKMKEMFKVMPLTVICVDKAEKDAYVRQARQMRNVKNFEFITREENDERKKKLNAKIEAETRARLAGQRPTPE